MIKTLLTRTGWVLAMLFVVAAALWAISRLITPTADQREAIALLTQQPEQSGSNAFGLLWTLQRDVPQSEWADVVRTDAATLKAELKNVEWGQPLAFESAAERFPDLSAVEADRKLFCSGKPGCLERVRAEPEAYQALIERNLTLLDRIERLTEYDYYRSEIPLHTFAPSPAFSPAVYPVTRHGLWFVQGRVDPALAATCEMLSAWRTISATADTLLVRLIGAAYAARAHGSLLAEMLAELPPGYRLPDSCARAAAPPTPSELWLCPAIRGEYRYITNSSAQFMAAANTGLLGSLGGFLAYDIEASNALLAEHLAPQCSQQALDAVVSGSSELDQPTTPKPWSLQCLGNYIGCSLAGISGSASAYRTYFDRMLDYGDMLRQLGTLIWLHQHPAGDRPLIQYLETRPDALKPPGRTFALSNEERALVLSLHEPVVDGSSSWTLPLPSSRAADWVQDNLIRAVSQTSR